MKAGIYKVNNEPVWIYVSKDRTIKAISHVDLGHWIGKKVVTKEIGRVVIYGNQYHCTRVSDVPNGTIHHAAALAEYLENMAADGAIAADGDYGSISGGEPTPVLDQPAQTYVGNAQRLDISESVGTAAFIENKLSKDIAEAFALTEALQQGSEVRANIQLSTYAVGLLQQSAWAEKRLAEITRRNLQTDRIEHIVQDEYRILSDEEREQRAIARLKAGEFRICHSQSARKHKKRKDREVWFHPVFNCYAWRKVA